jgi:hypothetical protein
MPNKQTDKVNFIVVGSRYQMINPETKEPVGEWGVGVFRQGVMLDLARQLYVELVIERNGLRSDQEEEEKAQRAAARAFELAQIFTEEMDKHFKMPPKS